MHDSRLPSTVTRRKLLQYGGIGCTAFAFPHSLQAGEAPSLGEVHNQTLDWFATTEKPLQVNPDGTLGLDEFKRLLSSTMTYAGFAYDVRFDIAGNIEIAIETTQKLELVEMESSFGPSIKNAPRFFYTAMIGWMRSKGAISARLARELQQLHLLAERAPDGGAYDHVVFKRLLKQRWNETDQAVVNNYLDVFTSSAAYWQEIQDADPQALRNKRWVVVGADALGVVGGAVVGWFGFGLVGSIVGGLAFGSACSGIASTW